MAEQVNVGKRFEVRAILTALTIGSAMMAKGYAAMAMVLSGMTGIFLGSSLSAANSDAYGGSFSCSGRSLPGIGTVYLPVPGPPMPGESLEYGSRPAGDKLVMSNAGATTLNGKVVSLAQLPAALESATQKAGASIDITPAKQTPFGLVVQTTAMLNTLKFCDFGFIGNEIWSTAEYYSKRDAIASRVTAPSPVAFTKASDAVITLDYGPTGAAKGKRRRFTCRMLFNGTPTDLTEVYRLLYRNLDRAIKSNGGFEVTRQLLAEKGPTALPVTIIQAKASLPWHCAAGAAYTAQITGYPVIDLVILPD